MRYIKLLAILSVLCLCGCMGPQASISDHFQDDFLFTAAQNVPQAGVKCIVLSKAYKLKSGDVTFALPAGKYIGKKKNDSGYFYYAPSSINTSNWLIMGPQSGIYLNNNLSAGNLFYVKPEDFIQRPVRGAVLPRDIFPLIRRSHC